MTPNCATASCHSQAAAVSGLDFSDADRGYKSLTSLWVWVPNPSGTDKQTLNCGTSGGVPVCEEHFRPLVTPFVPDESRLVNVLRGRGAPRMPPDRPLNEADIRLVEQWILDGARRDNQQPPPVVDAGTNDAGANDARTSDGGVDADGGSDGSNGADAANAGSKDASSDGDAASPSDTAGAGG
jgi:hypothetical protein